MKFRYFHKLCAQAYSVHMSIQLCANYDLTEFLNMFLCSKAFIRDAHACKTQPDTNI